MKIFLSIPKLQMIKIFIRKKFFKGFKSKINLIKLFESVINCVHIVRVIGEGGYKN
jgi:hypothetical protein